MTNAEIVSSIRASGYPDDLLDAMITESINRTLRYITVSYPLQTYGSFTTVAEQQIYDLFSSTVVTATQQGIFTGGLRVLELIGGPFQSDGSLSVFGLAPWLQMENDLSGMTQPMFGAFSHPGDFTMWEESWTSWVRRFGTFDFITVEEKPGAAIRMLPKPTDELTVLCKYTKPRTLANIPGEDEDWFNTFVESYCCRALAKLFSAIAGTRLGENADTGKTMAYWRDEAERLWELATEALDKRRYQGLGYGIRS